MLSVDAARHAHNRFAEALARAEVADGERKRKALDEKRARLDHLRREVAELEAEVGPSEVAS